MNLSVILCTYNRCQMLATALDSVAAQVLPASVDWEILVVDNNSRDQTREVVEGFCRTTPHCRYVFESQQGLSAARNAGIREARGEILVFVDDDVTVEPTWLKSLTAALSNGKWAGAGGRILPQGAFTPPKWLPVKERYAMAPLALFDPGLEAGPLGEAPFGANMAFRKEVFQKYGGFRTDLGRCGDSLLSNEDTEFGGRLLAAGEQLRYEPSAVVYHPVTENRIQKQYFLKWWFDKARGDVRESGIPAGTRWFIAGIPLYVFRRLAVWTLRWMIALDPAQRFSAKLKVWGRIGEIQECYRLAHQTKAQSSKP